MKSVKKKERLKLTGIGETGSLSPKMTNCHPSEKTERKCRKVDLYILTLSATCVMLTLEFAFSRETLLLYFSLNYLLTLYSRLTLYSLGL